VALVVVVWLLVVLVISEPVLLPLPLFLLLSVLLLVVVVAGGGGGVSSGLMMLTVVVGGGPVGGTQRAAASSAVGGSAVGMGSVPAGWQQRARIPLQHWPLGQALGTHHEQQAAVTVKPRIHSGLFVLQLHASRHEMTGIRLDRVQISISSSHCRQAHQQASLPDNHASYPPAAMLFLMAASFQNPATVTS
jgi:hypothetical protein